MKIIHAGLGVLLGGLLIGTLAAQATPATPERAPLVVGTFDSRGVAIAYIRSEAFGQEMRDLRAALAQAEADGDEERVAELNAYGPALQERCHRQGFGTLPVDNILTQIEDELPGIAAQAGVDVIVSKWCVTYQQPGVTFVDVTDELAAQFEPTEETLGVIRDVLDSEPAAAESLKDHEH